MSPVQVQDLSVHVHGCCKPVKISLFILWIFIIAAEGIKLNPQQNSSVVSSVEDPLIKSNSLSSIFILCNMKCEGNCEGFIIYKFGPSKPVNRNSGCQNHDPQTAQPPPIQDSYYYCIKGLDENKINIKKDQVGRLVMYKIKLKNNNTTSSLEKSHKGLSSGSSAVNKINEEEEEIMFKIAATRKFKRSPFPQALFPVRAILNQLKNINNSTNDNTNSISGLNLGFNLPVAANNGESSSLSLAEQENLQWKGLTSALASASQTATPKPMGVTNMSIPDDKVDDAQSNSGGDDGGSKDGNGMTVESTTMSPDLPNPTTDTGSTDAMELTTRKITFPEPTPGDAVNDEEEEVNSTTSNSNSQGDNILPPDSVLINDDTIAIDAAENSTEVNEDFTTTEMTDIETATVDTSLEDSMTTMFNFGPFNSTTEGSTGASTTVSSGLIIDQTAEATTLEIMTSNAPDDKADATPPFSVSSQSETETVEEHGSTENSSSNSTPTESESSTTMEGPATEINEVVPSNGDFISSTMTMTSTIHSSDITESNTEETSTLDLKFPSETMATITTESAITIVPSSGTNGLEIDFSESTTTSEIDMALTTTATELGTELTTMSIVTGTESNTVITNIPSKVLSDEMELTTNNNLDISTNSEVTATTEELYTETTVMEATTGPGPAEGEEDPSSASSAGIGYQDPISTSEHPFMDSTTNNTNNFTSITTTSSAPVSISAVNVCEFEDIEKFRRNIKTVTFGYNLYSESSLISFVDESPCIAIFSKSGRQEILHFTYLWPDLAYNELQVAGYADGYIYFIGSAKNQRFQQQVVRRFSYDPDHKSYNETLLENGVLPEFLSSVCGIEELSSFGYKMRSFLKLSDSSTCLVFNETSPTPLISKNATSAEISLAKSIEKLLTTEYVDHVTGLFFWPDEPNSIYLYASNGELYNLNMSSHSNINSQNGSPTNSASTKNIAMHWEPSGHYSIIPYEQFPL